MPRNSKNQNNNSIQSIVDFFGDTNNSDSETDYYEGKIDPRFNKFHGQDRFEKIKPKRKLQEW